MAPPAYYFLISLIPTPFFLVFLYFSLQNFYQYRLLLLTQEKGAQKDGL
jgi:uncharacterized membrane protein